MLKEKEMNSLRGLSFVFGVLSCLQDDPLCSTCRLFIESIDVARDEFMDFEKFVRNNQDISKEMRRLLFGIYGALSNFKIPDQPIVQKETGNCTLPGKVCLPMSVLSLYTQIGNKEVSKV